MKNFLQGLLIFFSLCLCGLISFQWVRETRLRIDVQDLTNKIQDKTENVLNLQGEIKRRDKEISRLDELKTTYFAEIKSNAIVSEALTKDLTKATNQLTTAESTVTQYKEALKIANENVVTANDRIKKAAEDIKAVSEERNEMAKKYNKMAGDFNELAAKWNKQQEELLRMATNNTPAPPQPKK
jgi:chromosome segregation ATPase